MSQRSGGDGVLTDRTLAVIVVDGHGGELTRRGRRRAAHL